MRSPDGGECYSEKVERHPQYGLGHGDVELSDHGLYACGVAGDAECAGERV
jgi:hypothetical protein